MIGCFGPAPRHPIPKTGDKRGQDLVIPGDLQESVCAFGLASVFSLQFLRRSQLSFSTGQIGFLLKIPQVISHLAQFLVVVGVC